MKCTSSRGRSSSKKELQIGVLSGIQGLRWYDLIIDGDACHAGPTPMESRRDPFMAAAPIMSGCYRMAAAHAPWGRATFGDIRAEPGSRNTVPERLVINVDLRHPDATNSIRWIVNSAQLAAATASRSGSTSRSMKSGICRLPLRAAMCAGGAHATEMLGYSNMDMVSGAGTIPCTSPRWHPPA